MRQSLCRERGRVMGTTVRAQGKAQAARKPAEGAGAEEIARVAYEFFERRGRLDGYDRQDWLEAEQFVRQRRGKA